MCLGLAAPAMAGSFDIQDGVLMKYTGTGGDVVIPKGVKTIGIWAFKESNSLFLNRVRCKT